MDNHQTENKIGKHGLIIFDGSCGACSTFIGEKKEFFEKYGFTVAPLQEQWVKDFSKLDEETLLQAIHLYTPNGEIVKGVDFFQRVASKVWWLKPFDLLFRVSFLKPIFTFLYHEVAKRRRKISQVCGLQSRAIYK